MDRETVGRETVTLNVTGMNCNGCAERISRVLARLPGVTVLGADHQQGVVEVRLDSNQASREEIQERIEHLGYGVEQ